MGQSLSNVYVNIVFSTKHRQPLIDKEIETRLFAYLAETCNRLRCYALMVGGYRNHVHILCTLSRSQTISGLLQVLKGESSKWIKSISKNYSQFYWQDGFGIFSVGAEGVDGLKNYIQNQQSHHQQIDFKQEYLEFLRAEGISDDETYLWD